MSEAKAEKPVIDMDTAWPALISYERGSARGDLLPLDEAVRGTLSEAAAREKLEKRFAAFLVEPHSVPAKEYVCSKLALLGTKASVPALAVLLEDSELSEAARNALERLPGEEASGALRDAASKQSGVRKVGAINSLGVRQDAKSISWLSGMLKDHEGAISAAAAAALGAIGTAEAAKALRDALAKGSGELRTRLGDPCLAAADRLLRAGKGSEARAMYQALAAGEMAKHVKVAVARGMLAVAKAKP